MKHIPAKYLPWIEARQRFGLSHTHIQMARELGLDPRNFGKLANHKQEPWKAPLPEFIANLYFERFARHQPENVRPLEAILADKRARKAQRQAGCQPQAQPLAPLEPSDEDEVPF